jgi:hypothetical protein
VQNKSGIGSEILHFALFTPNFFSGLWCNSSIPRCERDGPGANPGVLTNFDWLMIMGYLVKPCTAG